MEVLPCPILCDSTSIKPTFCWSCTLSRADPFIVLHHQLMPSRLSFGGNLFCVKLYFMLLNWLPRYGSRNKWRWKNYWYARCTQADATSEGHRSISTADHINNNNNNLYATILYEASFLKLFLFLKFDTDDDFCKDMGGTRWVVWVATPPSPKSWAFGWV